MGLAVYYKDEDDQFQRTTEDFDIPISTVHDGKTGDIKTVQLYLRNDDKTKWFSNVLAEPVDLENTGSFDDVAYTETGWGVKLNAGAVEPTTGEWDDLGWGEQISLSNVGSASVYDTTTYQPFWYYITCPPNEDVKIKLDIVLDVNYTENAVI